MKIFLLPQKPEIQRALEAAKQFKNKIKKPQQKKVPEIKTENVQKELIKPEETPKQTKKQKKAANKVAPVEQQPEAEKDPGVPDFPIEKDGLVTDSESEDESPQPKAERKCGL